MVAKKSPGKHAYHQRRYGRDSSENKQRGGRAAKTKKTEGEEEKGKADTAS